MSLERIQFIITQINDAIYDIEDPKVLTEIAEGYLYSIANYCGTTMEEHMIRILLIEGISNIKSYKLDNKELFEKIIEIIEYHSYQSNEPSLSVQLSAQNAICQIE